MSVVGGDSQGKKVKKVLDRVVFCLYKFKL